jgi:hypothetical protein
MPYFTLQLTAQGPMMLAYVGVSGARGAALASVGQAVPQPIQIRALVDTGASGTCVDPTVLQTLGLTPTGSVQVNTPSTGPNPHSADQYDVSIAIPGALPTHSPLIIENIPVVCADLLTAQGFHALVGRDILSLCLLCYDGLQGSFTLAY